jgi:hypothetical protein
MARSNLRLIAERLRWPEGALETCLQLEEEFPAWDFTWATLRSAFAAWSRTSGTGRTLYRRTPAAIRAAIETAPHLYWRSPWTPPGGWSLPADNGFPNHNKTEKELPC